MGQGRISFSRGPRTDPSFAGVHRTRFGVTDRDGAWDHLSGNASGSRGEIPPRVEDAWIRHTIERKQARLLQVSLTQRERIQEFVVMLFDEDSDRCRDMLEEALAEHGDPQKVVEALLEPAARMVGENWCTDECDFLKVTLAVSRMQRLFRRMVSEWAPTTLPDLSRCALLAPAPGEQHTFGLCVVDDALRRAGWEVDSCGGDVAAEVFQLVASNHYHIVGISISVERLLPELLDVSRKLRARSRNRSIVLIAGGSMVMQNPQSAIDAGFDLIAVDAVSAVVLADLAVASLAVKADPRMAAE